MRQFENSPNTLRSPSFLPWLGSHTERGPFSPIDAPFAPSGDLRVDFRRQVSLWRGCTGPFGTRRREGCAGPLGHIGCRGALAYVPFILSPGSQKHPQARPLIGKTSLAGRPAFEGRPAPGVWAPSLPKMTPTDTPNCEFSKMQIRAIISDRIYGAGMAPGLSFSSMRMASPFSP
jgi:hypothetical protein